MAGAEAGAEPHPGRRCQARRGLAADGGFRHLLVIPQLTVPFVQRVVIRQERVIKARHRPDDRVAEVVKLACLRDSDRGRDVIGPGNLEPDSPQVQCEQPRRCAAIPFVSTEQHAVPGGLELAEGKIPDRKERGTVSGRHDRLNPQRHLAAAVQQPPGRQVHDPVVPVPGQDTR